MDFIKNFSFNKLLNNKRFSIPFSILLAFICWVVLTINQKPTMERVFPDMTVTLENLKASENDVKIVGDISQQRFTVRVRGSNANVGALTAKDLELFVSAAQVVEPGKYELEVKPKNSSTDYEIISITPSAMTVNFDYFDTKEFTINALAEGATATEGLITEGGIVSGTQSDTVTINGPRSVINKIETVAALAKVNKTLSETETFDADIILYDADGKVIDGEEREYLTLQIAGKDIKEEQVKVTVPISKKKVVPVKVAFANLPDKFFAKSLSCSIDNASVTVIGAPETVDKTKEITLSPIDIRKVSPSSASFDVAPKLPEGVRLLDNIDHFTVKINLNNYAEKTVTVSSIKYVNLSSKLSTEGGTAIKNVKICGPKSVLDKIDESKIYAQTDLSGKKAGEHTVDVSINFSGYRNVWAIGNYKTIVTVK